jgi:hypothetical protein
MPLLARPAEQRTKAFELYRAGGKTHEEIGKALKIPATTISAWSYRYKWKRRAAALALSLVEPSKSSRVKAPAVPQIDASALTFEEKQSTYRDGMSEQAIRLLGVVKGLPDALLLASADRIEKLDKIARKSLNLEEPTPPVVVNIGLLSQSHAPQRTLPVVEAEIAVAK